MLVCGLRAYAVSKNVVLIHVEAVRDGSSAVRRVDEPFV